MVIAVGESMTLLGEKSWYWSNDVAIPFKGISAKLLDKDKHRMN